GCLGSGRGSGPDCGSFVHRLGGVLSGSKLSGFWVRGHHSMGQKRHIGRYRETRQQITEREQKVWALRQASYTYAQIGEQLGIDESTARKICKRIESRYLKDMNEQVAAIKVEQTTQLQDIQSRCLRAWEKSQQPSLSRTRRVASGAAGEGGAAAASDVTTQ